MVEYRPTKAEDASFSVAGLNEETTPWVTIHVDHALERGLAVAPNGEIEVTSGNYRLVINGNEYDIINVTYDGQWYDRYVLCVMICNIRNYSVAAPTVAKPTFPLTD